MGAKQNWDRENAAMLATHVRKGGENNFMTTGLQACGADVYGHEVP